MLTIMIPGTESYDEANQAFVTSEDVSIDLEHSLVSISKWEELHEVPFMQETAHTPERMLDYFRCMTLTPDVSPEVYLRLTNENVQEIYTYITRSMTATTVFQAAPKKKGVPTRPEKLTAELIYYWMAEFNIPFSCETWHLNKLLTLIKVAGVKRNPDSQKMSKEERAQWMREENARRMQQSQTTG